MSNPVSSAPSPGPKRVRPFRDVASISASRSTLVASSAERAKWRRARLSSGPASAHLEDARDVTSRLGILGPDGWALSVRAGSTHLPGMPRVRGRRKKKGPEVEP